jgi:hypothetical protein
LHSKFSAGKSAHVSIFSIRTYTFGFKFSLFKGSTCSDKEGFKILQPDYRSPPLIKEELNAKCVSPNLFQSSLSTIVTDDIRKSQVSTTFYWVVNGKMAKKALV